jgi:hypothetical protein
MEIGGIMSNAMTVFDSWSHSLQSSLGFWRNWEAVSQYQKDIWENYRSAFLGEFRRFIQQAPTYLSQSINPWSFSLMQFTSQMKGSPAVEAKILTEVAGYGSQLGTIMDFLSVVEKACEREIKQLKDPEDIYNVQKFQKLAQKIKKAKGE